MRRRIIYFASALMLIIIGTVLAQEVTTTEETNITTSGQEVQVSVPEEAVMMTGFSPGGRAMTAVDNALNIASGLTILATDSDRLSFGSGTGDQGTGTRDQATGARNQEPFTGDMEPVSKFQLIISEVYFDGTDEWVEISNIGSEPFYGDLTLSGAKSTPVTLQGAFLGSGTSKVYGDTLAQTSGTQFVGSTGLGLSIADTAAIHLQLIFSGQVVDEFVADQSLVNQYNDTKTSLEMLGSTLTGTSPERVMNAKSGYLINPGVYFTGQNQNTGDSGDPGESSGNIQSGGLCDFHLQDDLVKIDEIFPGNEKYPPYIELAIADDIQIEALSIDGDLLLTGVRFQWESGGMTLENNTFLLISSTGFRKEQEYLSSIRNPNFTLGSTGGNLLITISYRQSGQVLDIVSISGTSLGKSWYYGGFTTGCTRILDSLDYFSPGFDRGFLKYMPVQEHVQINTAPPQSCTGNLPPPPPISSTATGLIPQEYTIHILDVGYDPEGSDTDKEWIVLQATHISGNQSPLDLSKVFRLKVNGVNKTLPRTLPIDVPTTFTKTFGFPNSTKSGADVSVSLTYGDYTFDTYRYNPNNVDEDMKEVVSSTGSSVSSVIDGDTFRLKYQGTTQTVRLLGVDAPEASLTRYRHLECFGTEAKNYLKSLIDKKRVLLQFDDTQEQKDIYGRMLAYVYLDGVLINQKMIEEGYAKEYTFKTPYRYQSSFKDTEASARAINKGLRNEKTCGLSMSGILWTGDQEITGIQDLDLSGMHFSITYVLPDPKGKDTSEELGLLMVRDQEPGTGNLGPETVDLGQGFSLKIGDHTKKLSGSVIVGQENILSGNLGLVNKAACISFRYQEIELTGFCYPKPREGEKIFTSSTGLETATQQGIAILNELKLTRIGRDMCVFYKDASFLCKRFPASKAETKTVNERNLYKGFISLVKNVLITDRKPIYYNTELKSYFDLMSKSKQLIAKGISEVDIYGQRVSVTQIKKRIEIIQTTPPLIVAIYEGAEALRGN